MSRKVVPLTLDHLEALPAPCRHCLFWELDPVRRARIDDDETAATEKDAWLSHVLREWGSCGRVALVDDEPVGYLIYAPAAYVPGASGFPTAPVSPDAVLMTTAYVVPQHADGGLGRMLVQGMARDLVKRGGIRAVEAFGDGRAAGRCVVAGGFLARVGFKTHRPHPVHPRMRMELRSVLTWRDELEAAVDRLIGAVRPAPKRPNPARHTPRGVE